MLDTISNAINTVPLIKILVVISIVLIIVYLIVTVFNSYCDRRKNKRH